MKTLIKYIIFAFMVSQLGSCIVDTELREVPKDFLSPENTFTQKVVFESALAELYRNIRNNLYMSGDSPEFHFQLGIDADITTHILPDGVNGNALYQEYRFWNTINNSTGWVNTHWGWFYKWIFLANVVIDRAEDDLVKWKTDDEKNEIVAEAKFLRAFAYKFLAHQWGDVPLVLHETKAPKFDYVRTPRMEVYQQMKADLTEAVLYMKTVDQQPGGRAPRAAAYHLLSEVNICLGDYQGAIQAASAVINDPNFYLMTERFGVRKDFTFNGYSYRGPQRAWGDVYWDLFQKGNMNWKQGNHEAIWNIQMNLTIPGGINDINVAGEGAFDTERHYCGFAHHNMPDKNGIVNWHKDTLSGRPATGFCLLTSYVTELIWQYKGDWDKDIRNSEYNIKREYYWVNPASEFYGMRVSRETMALPSEYRQRTNPSFMKCVEALHYGTRIDANSGQKNDGGNIYKDWYIMRLPETYLLRAEAKFRSGDLQGAADDINVVRNRAKATPVTTSDVDIDLILDERARELCLEEFRTCTLMRMGKLVEYLQKYNEAVKLNKYQLPAYKNLFPIPHAAIEANKNADLGQNDGY